MLITPEYQAIQRDMHARKMYGHSGGKWAYTVAGIAAIHDCVSVLDYGCGTARMIDHLKRETILILHEYDPGIPGKDQMPEPADLVACIDTLEHIELHCLTHVIAHLHHLCMGVMFTVISTRLAGKILPDGRNAHLIVEPRKWWFQMLEPKFQLIGEWTHTADEWCALWETK